MEDILEAFWWPFMDLVFIAKIPYHLVFVQL